MGINYKKSQKLSDSSTQPETRKELTQTNSAFLKSLGLKIIKKKNE